MRQFAFCVCARARARVLATQVTSNTICLQMTHFPEFVEKVCVVCVRVCVSVCVCVCVFQAVNGGDTWLIVFRTKNKADSTLSTWNSSSFKVRCVPEELELLAALTKPSHSAN